MTGIPLRAGLLKTTLVDYPGTVAATIFLPGCNLRCPFCHNPGLVLPPFDDDLLAWDDIAAYLEHRRALLEGVCISGGEPLLHSGIPELVGWIHSLGLSVKIDTNGTLPDALAASGADFVAMDLKTSPDRYGELADDDAPAAFIASLPERITASASFLIASGTPHEFRTTAVPGFVGENDILRICEIIRGCEKYTIGRFRNEKTLSAEFGQIEPYDHKTLDSLASLAVTAGIPCTVRRA